MTVRSKITTKGFEEYLERIAQTGRNVDAIAAQALTAGGEIIADGMKRRVRKDTRNLESSIKVDAPHQDGNFVYVEIGLIDADADTARYGNAQEYGTASMSAQPYVRPALDEDMTKARAEMRKVFKDALE